MMKRFILAGAALLLFAAGLLNLRPVHANETTGVDVVLLIDNSGSMNSRDRRRTALESARMFIDLLETEFSRAGVIAFTDRLQPVVPLTPLYDPEEKLALMDAISGLRYYGYTDLGLPLMEAARMFTEDEPVGNRQMVLLLSDGTTELNPYNPGRTVEASVQDCLNAVDMLNGRVPIFVVALGRMSDDTENFLANLATDPSKFYRVTDAAGLPSAFNQIYASHTGSVLDASGETAFTTQGNQAVEWSLNIESPVQSVILTMFTQRKLTEITVIQPSGEEIAFGQKNIGSW